MLGLAISAATITTVPRVVLPRVGNDHVTAGTGRRVGGSCMFPIAAGSTVAATGCSPGAHACTRG